MEQSTSSKKVTVEYTDPSGIYAVISEDLQKHLPLRNLHWNSATRPLRSIASLHVDLVPEPSASNPPADPLERLNAGTSNGSAGRAEDHDLSSKPRPESGLGAKKERRHQIPGLRQTPYLKIFFLRCNDLESYRLTHRKHIREWIKGNTPPTQSTASVNTQEFHDAFEWLLVHVVLPDDGRSISRAPGTDKNDGRNGHRGSSAVTEKVRTDFNGSSKTAVDRVALVQITRDSQTAQSQGSPDGWEDFIAKAKSLILSSFDLRVTQYEEDIKERDSQRNIPGWNFNTFFVLKEGLARGFESVGLVEDALTGYRELAVGLNSILESSATEGEHRAQFRDFTDDLSAALKHALQPEQPQAPHERKSVNIKFGISDNQATDQDALGAKILDLDRKPFRELILANEISVFDFQCYLFAREASLLLRLASPSEPSKYGTSTGKGSVDVVSEIESTNSQHLLLLAEVCRRATEFFSVAGRLIRDDLRSSIHPLSKAHAIVNPTTLSTFEGPIEDIVASWTYAACQCILDATNVPSITAQLQPLLRNLKSSDQAHSGLNSPSKIPFREELPRRTSSLPMRGHTSPRPSPLENIPAVTSLDAVRLLPPASSQTGTQELAAQQAELVTLKRRIVASVGRRWNNVGMEAVGLAESLSQSDQNMRDLSLDDTGTTSDQAEAAQANSHGSLERCIQNRELSQTFHSESAFNLRYEELTVMALALNVLGDRRRSAESLTSDLAVSRYHEKEYRSAASYFHQLASFYCNNDWTRLELPMLDLYAQCLKHLGREQDFCRIGLEILAKGTSRRRQLYVSTEDIQHQSAIDAGYLQDVIDASRGLERPLSVPLHRHFSDVYVDPYIEHHNGRDGFRMSLRLRNLMSTVVEAQKIRVKLVNIDEEQRCDIWLTSEGFTLLQPGMSHVVVHSNVTCPAWYKMERIDVQSANIVFVHDAAATTTDALFGSPSVSDAVHQVIHTNAESILVWPDEEALEAKLSLRPSIHLGKPRSIEILISSGRNNVSHWRLGLRACSAGLRLHTGDSDIVTGHSSILDKSHSGSLEFGPLGAETENTVRTPYSLDTDLTEIKVRIEVSYFVNSQEYRYSCTSELPLQLPLSVNVQDNFQERILFSNFKIDTANSVPMRISDYTMQSSDMFEVSMLPLSSNTPTIFAHQPLSLVAKVQRKTPGTSDIKRSHSPDDILMLRIRYACLNQEVSTAVTDRLRTALYASEFRDLCRLLVTALGKGLRSRLSLQDLETIGLVGEVQLVSFDQELWQSVLSGLHPERKDKVALWLTRWQAANATIRLPERTDARNILELTVPVEVPQIPFVVTSRLDILSCRDALGEYRFAAIDQSLLAELSLQCSRYWANESGTASGEDSVRVTYEVQASPDVWLIGGQRKGQFTPKEGEAKTFPIILLPQKTGHLLYPSVEVRVTEKRGSQGGSEEAKGLHDKAMVCETDYLDQGESILIIPALSSSTVSLEYSNSGGGGAWLVECKSRSGK